MVNRVKEYSKIVVNNVAKPVAKLINIFTIANYDSRVVI